MKRYSSPSGFAYVSVLTPTVSGRAHLLGECIDSVEAQTYQRWEHVIEWDHRRKGCAITMNRAAREAEGEWLLPLADDDILLPNAISTFLAAADDDTDVVWGYPLVWGESGDQFRGRPPNISSLALIRRSAWEAVGGYDEKLLNQEDRHLWGKLLSKRYTFKQVDAPTWVYRFWKNENGEPGNKSRIGIDPLTKMPLPVGRVGITDPGTTLG